MADSTGASKPTWSWPSFTSSARPSEQTARSRGDHDSKDQMPGHFEADSKPTTTSGAHTHDQPPSSPEQPQQPPRPRPRRHYGPRTCRICLDSVQPTFHMPPEHVPGFLTSSKPRVTYDSDDPSLGRLLRPCKCKGSARYVHEGCLDEWRKADPAMGSRNYWQCPTCKFNYRIQRMSLGRWLNSTLTQLVLTITIFVLVMFLLGFVADPIINLYLDPYDTVMYGVEKIPLVPDEDGRTTWAEHFVKGLASLGVLGFAKALLAMTPWQWLNVRGSGIMQPGSGQRGTGRDRVANISWIVIVMGVGTFLWAVFKGVRAWSRRTLEVASEKVMDVPLDDGDDGEEDEPFVGADEHLGGDYEYVGGDGEANTPQ